MPDQLDQIEEDVRDLKDWAARHEERHGDDADMLGRVLDSLHIHMTNHHGTVSLLKQSSGITAVLVIIGAVAELIRRLLL